MDWDFILKNFGPVGVVVAVTGYLAYRGFTWYGTNILLPKKVAEINFFNQLGQESKDRVLVMEKTAVTLALINERIAPIAEIKEKINFFTIKFPPNQPVIITPEKKE